MILFFSIFKGKDREVPEWANFFNKKEYNYFIDLVEKYFAQKVCHISIRDGIVHVSNNDLGINNLGLLNLAQTCKKKNSTAWPRVVEDHFESLIESTKFETEFYSQISDFEKVKMHLGVKLYPNSYVETIGAENTISLSVTDELVELLIFDLPHTVINVRPQDITAWGIDRQELFAIGFANMKSYYPIEISVEDMSDYKVRFVTGNHVFASNVIFDKEELKKYQGVEGALIGIPHRHAVIIYPINDLEVVTVANSLMFIVKGMFNQGPGSICDNLYWYRNESLVNLPYEIKNEGVKFSPPESFTAMLTRLRK